MSAQGATVTVPASVDAAQTQLTSLHELVRASEWERAAIVYAFTKPQQGKRTSIKTDGSLTIDGFADLDIVGLKSPTSVRKYREAWQSAVDQHNAETPTPGGQVTLPDAKWPPPLTKAKVKSTAADRLYTRCTEFAQKSNQELDRISELTETDRRRLKQSVGEAEAALEKIRNHVDADRQEIPAEPVLVGDAV